MKPEINILQGDNRVVMKAFADDSFHAIVTDPPYHLTTGKKGGMGPASVNLNTPQGRARITTGFMGKEWDGGDIAFQPAVWKECLRVLKPGGYLLAFGGSRTYHRLACAIEDAGFEIRDMIEWIYGSGFPKSLDVSKAMDRRDAGGDSIETTYIPNHKNQKYGRGLGGGETDCSFVPNSANAKVWRGWGTALKPAHEPICVARKPLIGTVVENVLAHGTGAINIDACRIDGSKTPFPLNRNARGFQSEGLVQGSVKNGGPQTLGRFPANLIFDEAAAEMLDEQSGDNCGGGFPQQRSSAKTNGIFQQGWTKECPAGERDMGSGGASRFFYTAKASGSDRGNNVKAALPLFGVDEVEFRNTHPTVKPLALMTYLLKLVCPPDSKVLDPFCGSGTTALACKHLGIDCTGIELMEEYVAIIKERLAENNWRRGTAALPGNK